MKHMHIRRCEVHDTEAVLMVCRLGVKDQERHARLAIPPEDDGPFDREWREQEEGIARDIGNWWVADGGSRVLGFLWMQYAMDDLGPCASVWQVGVDPEHRNKGNGTLLLRHAEELSRTTDAVMILISGFVTNPAIQLYRRLKLTDSPDCYERDMNPRHFVLWKPLRGNLVQMDRSEQAAAPGRADPRVRKPVTLSGSMGDGALADGPKPYWRGRIQRVPYELSKR